MVTTVLSAIDGDSIVVRAFIWVGQARVGAGLTCVYYDRQSF